MMVLSLQGLPGHQDKCRECVAARLSAPNSQDGGAHKGRDGGGGAEHELALAGTLPSPPAATPAQPPGRPTSALRGPGL